MHVGELPAPTEATEEQGITILKPLDALGGMKGYLGEYQGAGVTVYVTPDGKHAISGYMYNEKGENLSDALIEEEIYAPTECGIWQRMEEASWTLDGKEEAPITVYVFTDPFCPYRKQFQQRTHPWVDSDRVQLRTLLVGVVKPENLAATVVVLVTKDPTKTQYDYETSGGKMKPEIPTSAHPEQIKVLSIDRKPMDDLGANVTLAIYYMNKDDTLQQEVGLSDKEELNIIMGNK